MTIRVIRQLAGSAAVAACVSAGCGLSKQDKPPVAGPSEFGQSISVAATPDRLSQDGVSQATVQVTVRDSNGKATPGVTVQWNVLAWRDANGNDVRDGAEEEFGTLVEPSSQQSTTDGNGTARIAVWAPPPPAVLPTADGKLRITARPVNGDAMGTMNERSVIVALVPPPGTLPPNRLPIAAFSIVPAIGNIFQTLTFDASQTMDEGEPCGDRCSYQWNFGDFEAGSGRVTTHTYSRPASFTVTMTVTDARGGVASTTRALTIAGPPHPVAAFSPVAGTVASGKAIVFNASASALSVSPGGTIADYTWDFGDGTTETTTVPIVSHIYTNSTLDDVVYPVMLTVKDNFGRTAMTAGSVTVTP